MRIFITAISKSGKPTLASRVAAEAECQLVINLGDVQVVYLEDSYVSVIFVAIEASEHNRSRQFCFILLQPACHNHDIDGLIHQIDFRKLDSRITNAIHKSVTETLAAFPSINLNFKAWTTLFN